MTTRYNQLILALDRYIETASRDDDTARAVAATADCAHADPRFREALTGLLAGGPDREALRDFRTQLSQAGYDGDPGALADAIVAVILIEQSSLGTAGGRALRNQADNTDVAAVRHRWRKLSDSRAGGGHPAVRRGKHRRPTPLDDDPLTSPSFPAVRASGSGWSLPSGNPYGSYVSAPAGADHYLPTAAGAAFGHGDSGSDADLYGAAAHHPATADVHGHGDSGSDDSGSDADPPTGQLLIIRTSMGTGRRGYPGY